MKSDVLKIYCDGGARGNPGPAAGAFVVLDNEGVVLDSGAKYLGVATNNVAEYTAVLIAVEWLTKNASAVKKIEFYLDSLLVVNQLKGLFKIKNETLREIANSIKKILAGFDGQVTFEHVRREYNTQADSLVNETLDQL